MNAPVRGFVVEFGATVYVTSAEPVPLAGVTVIHDAVVDANQPQPEPGVVVTLIVAVAPAADAEILAVGATE